MANAKATATDPKNAKNTAPGAVDKDGMPSFEGWEEEQVGFAPYWNPEEGKFFYGKVVARDERDPDFMRYLVQALMPHQCKRGAADDAEDVLVGTNEYFSISVYYSLSEPFDFALENFTAKGDPMPMKVTAIKKVKTKAGQPCWTWKMHLPPEYKKKLQAARELDRLAKAADAQERAALEA